MMACRIVKGVSLQRVLHVGTGHSIVEFMHFIDIEEINGTFQAKTEEVPIVNHFALKLTPKMDVRIQPFWRFIWGDYHV